MFKELFTEERGVSPVIGVILMVAITVILAAVIGAFVLGLGDQVATSTPQASFEYNFDANNSLNISHGGGDDIDRSTIDIQIGSQTPLSSGEDASSGTNFTVDNNFADPISTGSTIDISVEDGYDPRGDTVRVIWSNPSGGSSNTIGERVWPN